MVSMVDIKSEINLWWRMLPLIEHAWRNSILEFEEFGRPVKLERCRLKVSLDKWVRSIL